MNDGEYRSGEGERDPPTAGQPDPRPRRTPLSFCEIYTFLFLLIFLLSQFGVDKRLSLKSSTETFRGVKTSPFRH